MAGFEDDSFIGLNGTQVSSSLVNGNLFFTISGVPVEPESNLYAELSQERNGKVLWEPWGK